MEFKRICAHEYAGSTYVLGDVEDGEGPVILWTKPTTETTHFEANRVARNLANRYGTEYGCFLPYVLDVLYQIGGSHVN